MRIMNPVNGFVRLETGEHVILCDAWLADGIFDGSWRPYPPLRDTEAHLKGVTHCFISHIHEDHFDVATLERMDRKAVMLVPDVYPNHIMAARLTKMGFADVRMLKPGKRAEVSRGLTMEVVQRMNAYGQELEQYNRRDLESLVVDTGVIITAVGIKVVLLADNVPYCPEDAGSSVEHMKYCDLLAFSYNGAASDYPLCYENLSADEKRTIANEREDKREAVNRAFIDLIRPKALMPYSSEFALTGPMAKRFAEWCGDAWWADKGKVAERYIAITALPTFGLYEGDELLVTRETGYQFVKRTTELPRLSDVAEKLYSPVPNTRDRYPPVRDFEEIDALVDRASSHMFEKMTRYGIETNWVLELALKDSGWQPLYVDFHERRSTRQRPESRPMLSCICEANYLAGILRGECHWNNAMISFNLRWKRVPNEFDRPLFDVLNYFHVPRAVVGATAQSAQKT